MTALVHREVERTFSKVSRIPAGLPGFEPNQAGRENFRQFNEARSRVEVETYRHCGSLTRTI